VTESRFEVEEQEHWTECECPPSLCTHQPDYMRPVRTWIVWDTERQEHASITTRGQFQDYYHHKRDAVAAVRRYVEVETS
jgi:hypothetical protein